MNNQRFEQRMAVRPLRNNEVWYRARLRNIAKTARASVEPELRKFIKNYVKPENKDMAHHLAMTARQLVHSAAQKYMASTDGTGINTQSGRIASRAASINLDAVDRQFQKHLKQATGISAQFGKPDISHGKIVSTVHVGTGDRSSAPAPSDWLKVDWQRRDYDPVQYEAWLRWAKDFDPDQPRDETGKWSGSGGTGANAVKILSRTSGANARLVGSRAMGTARPDSDYDVSLDTPSHEFNSTPLEKAGWKSLGSSLVSPKEAASYKKPVRQGWSRIHHFEHPDGTRLDVWTDANQEPSQAKDFDPDQPRDETGKWTSGGTSGYTGSGVSSGRRPVNPNDPRERQRAQADLAQSRGVAEAGAGSLPYTYTRRSGRDVEGVRVLGVPVRESWSLDSKTADELKAKGYASPDVHELDYNDPRAAQVFHDQIAQTKVGNRFAASVHVYSPEEYGQMRMFLSKDGKAGMALKPDGDMVSAFVHGDGPKGAIHTMLEVQKQAGGTKLDCFDTVLPAIYAPHGFTAVARTTWNDEYKPEGWDKNTYAKFNHGEPDVVFMARSASAAPYHAGDGVRVDYDKAVSIQQAAVNQFLKRSGTDFDPDQPRDETGKWTSGGASAATSAESYSYGGREQNEARYRAIAQSLGFPSDKIKVSDDTFKFSVAGKQMTSAATANRDGTITVHAKELVGASDSAAKGLMAHEVMHQRYAAVKREATEEHIAAIRNGDAERVVEPLKLGEAPKANRYLINPDAYAKYPHAAIFDEFDRNADAYAKEDGVSLYSQRYWKDWKAGKDFDDRLSASRSRATNETLAEIAKIYTDKHPDAPEIQRKAGVGYKREQVRHKPPDEEGRRFAYLSPGTDQTVTPRWRKFYDQVYKASEKFTL